MSDVPLAGARQRQNGQQHDKGKEGIDEAVKGIVQQFFRALPARADAANGVQGTHDLHRKGQLLFHDFTPAGAAEK